MSRTSLVARGVVTTAAMAIAFAAVGPSPLAAQTGTINATATVLQPITITGSNDLQFGNVFPGVNKTVDYTDATNAGKFTVGGDGGAQVAVSFTLPTDLNGPAGSTLPISTWTGYYNTTNSATSGGASFTPSATSFNTNLSGTTGSPGSLYVFLGATVTPAVNQTQGAYSNTVTMTVAYTGS
ncbi:MAG TPA: DUF4402 domain-containing protein [Gemmatimonadaceae bacterium]|nr:DUF4402 domain-containing protein [Gemmatimonadaceae bacterium]